LLRKSAFTTLKLEGHSLWGIGYL